MKKRASSRGANTRSVLELVRELAAVLPELGLAEVEVRWRDVQVRVRRPTEGAAGVVAPAPTPAVAPAAAPTPGSKTTVTIEAPMVGTFYRAPSPTADPFVREGDVVKEGQCLCIIEAMKLMNEIESQVAGRIVRILVENGQAVEYGQPLFLIDPRR